MAVVLSSFRVFILKLHRADLTDVIHRNHPFNATGHLHPYDSYTVTYAWLRHLLPAKLCQAWQKLCLHFIIQDGHRFNYIQLGHFNSFYRSTITYRWYMPVRPPITYNYYVIMLLSRLIDNHIGFYVYLSRQCLKLDISFLYRF